MPCGSIRCSSWAPAPFGPAIAGIVLQAFGPSTAFFANAVSFLLVLVALLLIHPRAQVFLEDDSAVFHHFREGWRFVRSRTAMLLPIVMIGMVSLLGTSVIQLAPAMAKEEFHVGKGAYGWLVAAFGLGAITGSLIVAVVADRFRRSFVAMIGGMWPLDRGGRRSASRRSTALVSPRCIAWD